MALVQWGGNGQLVAKPTLRSGGCWALKRMATRSLAPQYVNCAKAAREGKLTCHWHDKLEAMAKERQKRA